ncbi:MAG: sulfatase-like hydrolase/transferase [Paludibacteraceae bacterium]|nr:sulfatase-like hydrolase/transferase [Paludibacteraceae bacterium]
MDGFILFFCSIFAKELIFHWYVYHSVLISSFFHAPLDFFVFWLGKLTPALLISSFVFLSKRLWWTIVVSVIIDVWCIVNLTLLRSYGSFITWGVVSLASNLHGFEDAVITYIHTDTFNYFFITIAYVFLISITYKLKNKQQDRIYFLVFFTLALASSFLDKYLYSFQIDNWSDRMDAREIKYSNQRINPFESYFPFGDVHHWAYVVRAYEDAEFSEIYVPHQSIVSYFVAMPLYHFWTTGKMQKMTDTEKAQFNQLIDISKQHITPKTNLIVLLVESLESWPLDSVAGFEYMPNLSRLVKRDNILFCKRIKSETKHGNSGDGQMIVLSGLLPIDDGAACCLYDENVYPSYIHSYDNAVIVNPSPGAWHQTEMSHNYGFTKVIEPKENNISDEWVINSMIDALQNIDTPFCMLGITMSSHLPFTYGKEHPIYHPNGMPQVMSNYLNSLYYTDICIGHLIDYLHSCGLDKSVTLVITGDHAIFRDPNYSQELDDYAVTQGIDFKNGYTYIPLIISGLNTPPFS